MSVTAFECGSAFLPQRYAFRLQPSSRHHSPRSIQFRPTDALKRISPGSPTSACLTSPQSWPTWTQLRVSTSEISQLRRTEPLPQARDREEEVLILLLLNLAALPARCSRLSNHASGSNNLFFDSTIKPNSHFSFSQRQSCLLCSQFIAHEPPSSSVMALAQYLLASTRSRRLQSTFGRFCTLPGNRSPRTRGRTNCSTGLTVAQIPQNPPSTRRCVHSGNFLGLFTVITPL